MSYGGHVKAILSIILNNMQRKMRALNLVVTQHCRRR